ncbi:hypothetical protein [Rhodoligotrophos defluvii]|uniref:hypothetical protein n=1 Tax=Rhodoligotrophos defluvii TaxID=2561934 RepID=UPI0010C93B3D|nr:hypothetical protein [Rhodoligotrophos defluvii]
MMLQVTPRKPADPSEPRIGHLAYFDAPKASARESTADLVMVVATGRTTVRVPLTRHELISAIKIMAEALA